MNWKRGERCTCTDPVAVLDETDDPEEDVDVEEEEKIG